jgi:RNA polymerase sigma-70 factor (ECF subfamily)
MARSFADAFFAAIAGGRAERGPDLEAALDEARSRAARAWPPSFADDATFGEALGVRVRDAEDPAAALRALHVEEVYLVLGCAAGRAEALAELERTYFPALRAPLARMGLSAAGVDEALQRTRDELFVVEEGRKPRVLGYAGRGQLGRWLRAVAGRIGLRVARASSDVDSGAPFEVAAEEDLEIAYLKRIYGAVFQEALREALDALAAADRLLLKQRFRHGLSIDELAAMQGVHASTASRRVSDARSRLVGATRDGMMRRLQVGRAEVSSILRLIQSEIEVSLSAAREPENVVA